MTCIAAVIHGGRVVMGGDSAVTNESWQMVVQVAPKVFRRGEYLMGVAGRSRLADVIEHAFMPPDPPDDGGGDLARFMATSFIDAMRAAIKAAGHGKTDSDQEYNGGHTLVGLRGRIFKVGDDYYAYESRDGYAAIGDGDELAQGSLFATAGGDPVDRILTALRAAAHHKASVRAPYTVLGPDGLHREVGG